MTFFFPVEVKSLRHALRDYDGYVSLSVNWKLLGTGNVSRIPANKLLIETLASAHKHPDVQVKTIVKPRYVEFFKSVHFPKLKSGFSQVTENFECFSGAFVPAESRKVFRINHYWVRDMDFLFSQKLNRTHTKTHKSLYLKSMVFPSSPDKSVFRFLSDLKAKIFSENVFQSFK